MDKSKAPRIALALVTVCFAIYMIATISAVQAELNVYAKDASGVLQLSAAAISSLVAGLAALTLQNFDKFWISLFLLVTYGFSTMSAMAALDSELFLHRPITMLWMLLIWFVICFFFYFFKVKTQWREAGQEIVDARIARSRREAERERRAKKESGALAELPEWEDTTLPPPRL
ncbi:MAG: hypothetical protein IKZ87_00725 [Actinomycetaceae bacterium]|nr:hypothetical protein [Actinomycetaceae bacterium]